MASALEEIAAEIALLKEPRTLEVAEQGFMPVGQKGSMMTETHPLQSCKNITIS